MYFFIVQSIRIKLYREDLSEDKIKLLREMIENNKVIEN